MSKCADSPSISPWNRQTVAMRVVETVVAGLVILMMAACNVGPNYHQGMKLRTVESHVSRKIGEMPLGVLRRA
jgi:hypothetical protein